MDMERKAKLIKTLSIVYLILGGISFIYSVIQLFVAEEVLLAIVTIFIDTILFIGNFFVYTTVARLAEYIEPIESQLRTLTKRPNTNFGAKVEKREVTVKKVEPVYNPTNITSGERWTCECGESNHPKAIKCINCGKDRP